MWMRWVGAIVVAVLGVGLIAGKVCSQPAATQSATTQAGEEVPPFVQTDSLLVVVAPSGDTVWGYTKETGKWFNVVLTPPSTEPIRLLGGKDVVIFQDRNLTYALGKYSKVGWHVLGTSRQPQVKVMEDWVIAEDGDSIHAFSAKVGKWSSVNIKTNRSSNSDG
jgi:hypothetical protein